jgi:diguanylate cyclase (GGDEF)-like protein/PAS domain S-box-containing protein
MHSKLWVKGIIGIFVLVATWCPPPELMAQSINDAPAVANQTSNARVATATATAFLATLTEPERAWLREHPVISVVQDPNWPPIEFADEHGQQSGMTRDYLNLIEARLGLKFKPVLNLSWQEGYARLQRAEIDMTSTVAQTAERLNFWAFTKPYMNIPIVIATQQDVTYIASMHELAGKRVAVVAGYAVNDWIPRDFPDIHLVKVQTSLEGLQQVQRGEVDAFVDSLLTIGYYQARHDAIDIKIAGATPYFNAQRMAVRKDWAPFAGILQKALDSISEAQRDEIHRRWLPIRYEHGFDYTRLWQALAVFGLVLLGLWWWNRRLTGEVRERKQAQAELGENQALLRSIIDSTPADIFAFDLQQRFTLANTATAKALGLTPQELLGKTLHDVYPLDQAEALMAANRQVLACAEPLVLEENVPGITGRLQRIMSTIKFPLRDAQGQISGLGGVATDITERKQSEQALRIAAIAFESQQGMIICNAHRVIQRVNQAFTAITGYGAAEVLGQHPGILAANRHDSSFYAVIAQTLAQKGEWAGEIWSQRKSGEEYPAWLSITAVKDADGLTTHFVDIFSDVSERFSALAQIDSLAFYDHLTRLPNRRLLLDRLDQALHASTRHARKNALLFVDLDNFKTLNDTLGHSQGDLLLVQVARRLGGCIREGDTVARLSSDEFVILLEDLSEDASAAAAQAEVVGEKILAAFLQQFQLDQGAQHSAASIGITLFGGATLESSEQPLKRAELAMFQAKAAGRSTLRFFDAQMQAEVSARAGLEADLREALHKRQFELYYQPQVVGAGRITGVEALLRWQHPLRGMVSPAAFIPLAEETGLILPIGQWVLETACAQLAAWAQQPEFAHLTMAVNVSARQFKQANFVYDVLATLARTQAKPKLLKLELTESMLVDDVDAIIIKMGVLKAQGVSFSLDDFGTGYSSLAYLKRLPLDQLKIDQGFIRNIVTDPNDAVIAKMVIALADSTGLAVIAEGVELQAQADFLAHLGCHAYQGYLFSKPLPLAALESFARQRWQGAEA